MTKSAFFLAASLLAGAAHAQVSVADAWARTTVPRQTTSAAYFTVTSARGGKLVDASSPLAASAEVHEMKMAGDLMKMRAVDAVPLPAGKPVAFAPNGYHLMLMGLKAPLTAGEVVPIRLVVEDAKGRRETVQVRAVAKPTP